MGWLEKQRRHEYIVIARCRYCKGTGKTGRDECAACNGTGRALTVKGGKKGLPRL